MRSTPLPAPDLERLYGDIELFGVPGQVLHLLEESGRLGEVPGPFADWLRARRERMAFQNLVLRHKSNEVLALLDTAGIATIPLKGVWFAERFFGHVAGRGTSDIDLLVHPERLGAATALLERSGYAHRKDEHNHTVLEQVRHGLGINVELHWKLDKARGSAQRDAPLWAAARRLPGYTAIYELDELHVLYAIVLHGLRHRLDSIKYVLDIAQVIRRLGARVDYAALLELAAAEGTLRRVKIALSVVYTALPGLNADAPLPFEPLQTPWSCSAIRAMQRGETTAESLRWRLFCKLAIYDSMKHRVQAQRPHHRPVARPPGSRRI
ncbi:nucleotidyltransferase family protein [Paenibacillus sp. IB182496]|uniref:Nucleotidyltransferase family protein n=1 Tax=Paenibacillus sabuli TaxID=2772509 RepID=A0A927BZK9_9BACL|nr:nucleotidyltransferase family protein [Paenibacillus sabuli]MBD2848645.1 nucleotidyltransferase family protein [Paenibacillus sabuli]